MPHLTGVSLVQFLNERGRPSVTAACRIAREIASGLAAAHAHNLLHRDIKPGNIFLEAPRGRVKLLDFGLATSASGDGRLTQTGMVVGTPAYMSPEQARGLPLDVRADLFSLGAVMYHLTTGRMPFEGPDSLAVLTALAIDTPAPVREANPKVPARLEALIDRLLCKSVAGRPDSAVEVVDELKAIEKELTEVPTNGVTLPVAVAGVVDDEIDASPSSDGDSDADPMTPVPTRRRRKKKGKKAKWQRYKEVGLLVAGIAGLLALVLGVTMLLSNLNRTPAKANPPATTAATPTTAAARTEYTRPWEEVIDGRPQWMWYDRTGTPKPLPDIWKPGMPVPPEFQLPPRM
jgi:serine/threonine protein kinase